MGRGRTGVAAAVVVMLLLWGVGVRAQEPKLAMVVVRGVVRDGLGVPVAGATVRVGVAEMVSDAAGRYQVEVPPGVRGVEVRLGSRMALRLEVDVEAEPGEARELDLTVGSGEEVTVRAEDGALQPDPSEVGYVREELLATNPGRPGVPVSVPGYPVETASGGIKAPQYFAPGVAGDHGEPIAQFFAVDGFLLGNNLTANAHGNGYADPNFVIGATIGEVLVDGAGYNARYGDHAVNLAVRYGVRDRIERYAEATTDGRDGSVGAGWAPRDDRRREWVAGEALFGNGFLERPEERQQYRVNALRGWAPGRQTVTAYGVGYYGFSRDPGLIPIGVPVPGDTVDPRQADLTHTAIGLVTDRWEPGDRRVLLSGAYFRTYSLALRSNFGDGLIRQSEFRTVVGGGSTWEQGLGRAWTLLAGGEWRRDAPRGLDLAHADAAGSFQLVTSNDLTIGTASGFAAVSGRPVRWIEVYGGLRRDQLRFTNRDLLLPANSFDRWPGVWGPKATVTLGGDAGRVGFSFGEAFHANDPRIGTATGAVSAAASLIVKAREWQMVAEKPVAGVELKLILSRVTNAEELAKIDADTGLEENVGPSRNRFLTASARRRFRGGWVQASWSAADARDRQTGAPVPEAPRTIADAVGGWTGLPWGLGVKSEFEYVRAKPLGDGFTGVPVREERVAVERGFREGRWVLGLSGLLANGYSGQTLETLAVGGEASASEQAVGVPVRSYGAVSLRRVFGR